MKIKNRPQVSVAMATYNGEKYVLEQIESILNQLESTDELIISDNGSTDATIQLIETTYIEDSRVTLVTHKIKGVTANFDNAISLCQNEIIFLSDQDDVWKENKVEVFLKYFKENPSIDLMISDITVVDNDLNTIIPSFYEYRGSKTGVVKNIIKNSYIGCAMAFRKSLTSVILPIPHDVPMHDMWFGIKADQLKKVKMIPENLVYYRRHEDTVTTVENKSKIMEMIKWRLNIIKLIYTRKK